MGRSGYETTNSNDAPSSRSAGMGVTAPSSPKRKGKEPACNAPSGLCSAAGTDQTPRERLPPVKRSSDFREAVIEPFPELPPSLHGRRRPVFGLDIGPRTYAAPPRSSGAGAGFDNPTRTGRPRALELDREAQTGGSRGNPIDVEMGGTDVPSPSSPASSAGTVTDNSDDDMDDDGLKTPRASHSALPEYQPSQLAQRLHQQHGYGNVYQYPSHFTPNPKPPPPPPGKILRSQASQFPLGNTPNNSNNTSAGNGNGNMVRNFHTMTQGLRPGSLRPGNLSSGCTLTSGYDFGGSSGSYSSSSSQSFGMSTTPRQQNPMGFPPGWRGLMSRTATSRASELGPPPGFGYDNTGSYTGFNTGRGAGAGDDFDSYFARSELTQTEKDRRRKAALDAGFEELKAKKQRTRK